jgi:hypothetical protein
MVNVTLCFSANQALLAAKAGATFISPFIGRLDDINLDGMELIADIRQIYDNYGFETQILAASIRTVNHMTEAAKIGADVATAPPEVIRKMAQHPLTDKGLETFLPTGRRRGRRSSDDLRGLAMERLETRLERLEDTHRSVIAAAYENLAGTNQMHRAILRILEPTDFEEFLTVLDTDVAEILRVDNVRLVLESRGARRTPRSAARTRSCVWPNPASSTTT